MSDEAELNEGSMSLIEHLAELRSRLIRSLIAFIIAMMFCFYVARPIWNFLARPAVDALKSRGQDAEFIFTGLQQGFMTDIRIALFGGFVLAFPVIAHQLWRFVAPGLYRQEKNAFLPFLIASPFMFFLGAAFAYLVVLPLAFDFFLGFQQSAGQDAVDAVGISYLGTINEYLGLTMKFVLAFGLCFQLPVLLTLLGKADLVSSEGLSQTRKYAVVGIMALAAVVTPPDVITQVILFVVVYGLYEVSIWLVRLVERDREKRLREEGLWDEDLEDEELADAKPASAPEERYKQDFEAESKKWDAEEGP